MKTNKQQAESKRCFITAYCDADGSLRKEWKDWLLEQCKEA
jgi:hypothetical protein